MILPVKKQKKRENLDNYTTKILIVKKETLY